MATITPPTNTTSYSLIALPAFNDNYIWLVHRDGLAMVVDPGQAEPVFQALKDYNLTLDTILLTHHHADHVGGVLELQQRTDATVYGPATEKFPACDHRLAENDTVNLSRLGLQFRVLDQPGHTAGHIAYHGDLNPGQHALFCGDTLFAAGCGRIFEGTPAQMFESLGKLRSLPSDTLVCCAHEYTLANLRWALQVEPDNPVLHDRLEKASEQRARGEPTLPSTIDLECRSNPFLRSSHTSVANAAARYANTALSGPLDVFTCLRDWKNNF
jgi:hydroxyacylglutathione hydrolase